MKNFLFAIELLKFKKISHDNHSLNNRKKKKKRIDRSSIPQLQITLFKFKKTPPRISRYNHPCK